MNNELRERVFKRDKYTCQYCGRKFAYTWRKYKRQVILECDHIIPVRVGGSDTMDNLVACCSDCNQLKKHYTLSPMEAKLNVQMLARYEREYIDDEGRSIIIRPPHSQGLGGIMSCRQ